MKHTWQTFVVCPQVKAGSSNLETHFRDLTSVLIFEYTVRVTFALQKNTLIEW